MSKQKSATADTVFRSMLTYGIYKPTQGRIIRQATAVSLGLVLLLGCYSLYLTMGGAEGWLFIWDMCTKPSIFQVLMPLSIWVSYRTVCIPKFADFLIATEAEMNKVSWPSQAELIRGSIIVLVTIIAMAAVLFLYDIVWNTLLRWLEVIAEPPA